MLLRLIYDEKLAQASYLLGDQDAGEAIVVDPSRDAEQYIRLAKREGVRIKYVTETHIHADYLSGSRELAHRTGAKLYLSREGGADWSYRFPASDKVELIGEGSRFKVGSITIDVVHTPGHTPEHICFLVTDSSAADRPIGMFSGDFVFVGDVGRPDLLEKAAGVAGTMEAGARALFKSLQRFRTLPDYMQVWPGHGAGSACGKALGAVPQTTVGYEKMFSLPVSIGDEAQFVDMILSGQPEPPKYFATMKRLNRDGPPLLGDRAQPAHLDPREIDVMLQSGTMVVDTRTAAAFAQGHVPGSINIPYNKSFTNWCGWLIPYDRDFAVIIDDNLNDRDVARDLSMIGLDRLAGYFTKDALNGRTDLQTTASVSTSEMARQAASGEALVIDVRNSSERAAGHIPGTQHVHLGYIAEVAAGLPRDRPIIVHCQGGGRSAIAASVLQAAGLENVMNTKGGYGEWGKGRVADSDAS
jgi:hydroxyacylglutathione hydrolase